MNTNPQAPGMEFMRENIGQKPVEANTKTSQAPGVETPMRSREVKKNTTCPSLPSGVRI